MNEIPIKRGRGRPRKNPPTKMEAKPDSPKRWKMTAKPNWETVDADDLEYLPDRLRIDRSLWPEGMDLRWVRDSYYGQPDPKNRGDAERKGWTPIHQSDFSGQFNGVFMKKNAEGEINVDGLVLMARPEELSIRARRVDERIANEAVQIKEAQLTGGDLPGVTLDTTHKTALNSNKISKTLERIEIPDK